MSAVNGFYAPYRHLRTIYSKMYYLRAWRQDRSEWMFWRATGYPAMPGYDPLDLTVLPSDTNMVAWWRLGEEDAYPNIKDSKGSYDGTMVSMEWSDNVRREGASSSTFNKYWNDNGNFSASMVGQGLFAFERTKAFSVSFWAISTQTGWRTLMGKRRDSPYTSWVVMQNEHASGTIMFEMLGTGSLTVRTNDNLVNTGWHHFVITYDGSSTAAGVTIYMDGAVAATTTVNDTLSGSILTTAPFQIGASGLTRSSAFDYWYGYIGEVAIWNKELSPSEAAEVYNNRRWDTDLLQTSMAADLLGWWRMVPDKFPPTHEDSAYPYLTGTMWDSSGNGNDLDCYNITPDRFQSSSAVRCLRFDGSEHVSFGDVLGTAVDRDVAFSISLWVNTSVTSSTVMIARQNELSPRGWTLETDGSRVSLQLVHTWATNCISAYSDPVVRLNDGLWHHIVVTFSGSGAASGVKFYIDGVLKSTGINYDNLVSSIYAAGTNLTMGRRDVPTSYLYFTGDLDNVSFYNTELTSEEALALYAAAMAGKDTTIIHVDEIEVVA
jgi:hypothetical protein